jgi:hypothetical protein
MRLNIRNASRQNVQTTSISTLTSFTSGESIDHKAIKRRSLAGEPIRENIPQQEAFLLHRAMVVSFAAATLSRSKKHSQANVANSP